MLQRNNPHKFSIDLLDHGSAQYDLAAKSRILADLLIGQFPGQCLVHDRKLVKGQRLYRLGELRDLGLP